jgi:hypothetical protein
MFEAGRPLIKTAAFVLPIIGFVGALWFLGWAIGFDIPRIPERQYGDETHTAYSSQSGSCDPGQIASIPNLVTRSAKKDECDTRAEVYRLQKEELNQAVRTTNAAEESLRLSWAQTRIGFAQAILTLFALAFACWAAWEAGRAASAAKTSVDDARADATEQVKRFRQQMKIADASVAAARASVTLRDRAWVRVKTEIVGPLIVGPERVTVGIKMTVENVGRSPATNVVWDFGLYASAGAASQAIRDSTRYDRVGILSLGSVLFPNDEDASVLELTLSTDAWSQACAENAEDLESDIGSRTLPVVVAGIHYAVPGETNRRFTYVSYALDPSSQDAIGFDDAQRQYDVHEIALRDAQLNGPVT